MKRTIAGGLLAAVTLLGGLALTSTPASATRQDTRDENACYELIEQAQYKKFTAPTDAGPWVLYGTWWKGQANTWHADVGEVAEGPGNHPDGRYTYRRVAQQTVNGEEVPCPIPASRLGLTYNQDCPVDETNTWRIRPVEVNQAVAWELTNAPGTYAGTMNPGDGEFVVEAPRAQTTAILKWDSDGNGSLDKQSPKASGPDLPADIEKCAPPVTTVPDTTVPETTQPPTTEPPATTQPPVTTVPPHCPEGQYPQSYADDAPCGPIDPCVGINPDTGLGTTLWGIQECGTPVTTTAAVVTTSPAPPAPQSLPETGAETWVMAIIAGLLSMAGFGAVRLARRTD